MTDNVRAQAIALYDRFTHEGMDRRAFMSELTKIAGSAAAANALLIGIAADPAAAAIVPENDARLKAITTNLPTSDGGIWKAYAVEPKRAARTRPTIMVIHENRGLTAHIRDVARRLALAGYYVLAPDFLSRGGGATPADENAARDAIGKLDLARATADGVAALDLLRGRKGGNGKVGATGFCWGGAYVNRLAVAAGPRLGAGVPYYGPAPAPAEAARVGAPLLIHLAGNDTRVNATAIPWAAALKAARKDVTLVNHPNVEHAFNNDSSAERYNKAAADRAWSQTLAFFARHLR